MDNLDYGVVGNGRSCALISRLGSIDWCCLSDFDSPSVFGALLDPDVGGHFDVEPQGDDWQVDQSYLKHTNILCTRFTSQHSDFEVIDFMPCYHTESGSHHCPPEIVRFIVLLRGSAQVRFGFKPRLAYAEHPTRIARHPKYLKAETTIVPHESVYLYSNYPLDSLMTGEVLSLEAHKFFLLSYDQKIGTVDLDRIELELQLTKAYWMAWAARTTRTASYSNAVERSALALKLLSYRPTGAILAAATTSLPEAIGEERNWDYRYCWIRDASMTLRTLVNLQHHDVARRFFDFLLEVVPYKNERIQVMYGIRGQKQLDERTLDWLSGYGASKPVRIGNAAWTQQQNDIYGVLLDALYHGFVLFRNQTDRLEALWTITRGTVRHIQAHWRQPDQGIWEIRGAPQHFTYSKVMCWVGMDRATRMATMIGMDSYAQLYGNIGEEIRNDIMEHGWNPKRKAFTQAYGSDQMDAAVLLLHRLGFIDSNDARWVSTVRTAYDELCHEGLMYRYTAADDFGVPSSSFTPCTFWMIQALFSIGDEGLARQLLANVLACGNHVGLFSEDLDFSSHRLLGNFPQAYSHLALIDTIFLLDKQPLPAQELLIRTKSTSADLISRASLLPTDSIIEDT